MNGTNESNNDLDQLNGHLLNDNLETIFGLIVSLEEKYGFENLDLSIL